MSINLFLSPVQIINVKKIYTDQEMEAKCGEFLTLKSDMILLRDHDCSVYKEDNTPLLHFRKHVIPADLCNTAFKNLKKAGKVKNNNRGIAAGKFDKEQFLKEHPKLTQDDLKIQKTGFMGYYGKTKVANYSNSGVIGYMDSANRMKPEQGKCRLTSFSAKNMKKYEETLPFFKYIDNIFKTLEPERHEKQKIRAEMSQARVSDTSYTTITVNYNWKTAVHTDSGDYQQGFGCFAVTENTENKTTFEGCELIFPQYNVAVDCRHGDVLLFDSHAYHCNNEAVFGDDKERLSFVCYLKTEMLAACTNKTDHPVKQMKKFKMAYRPGSTDEKAMKEVAETKVYNSKDFSVKEGDIVLDCGGQIGSFTMYALSLGAAKVKSVEPHYENLKYLKENAYLNTWEDKVQIIPGAVCWSVPPEDEQKLYITKESTNTYRHTIVPTKGRESISVKYYTFNELLTDDITFVKMDIESSEHEILENCSDWKNVKRLVFEWHYTRKQNDPYATFEKFHAIMDKLRNQGFTVKHKPVPLTGTPSWFPCDMIVFCNRNI